MECVSLYRGTRDVLRWLFLGNSVLRTDPSTSRVEFIHVHPRDRTDIHIQKRNNYLRHFIATLVEEYEEASKSESLSSFHYRLLLLPHLESLLQVVSEGPERVGGSDVDLGLEAGLCSVLGAAYQLDGNHSRAREVLERALRIWKGQEEEEREKGEAERSLQATDISLKLGSSYRHLGMLAESECVLQEALSLFIARCGDISREVADTLTLLSSTYNDRGAYNESRKSLERAMEIYETLYGAHHPLVGVAMTSLGVTWRLLGNSLRSMEFFEESLAIQEKVYESNHPSLAFTLRNLSMAYLDLGQPQKSIELLKRARDINAKVHGPDHISGAVILSGLSVAYRRLGNTLASRKLASQALEKMEGQYGASPGVAVALGVLGTAYSDLGQLDKARELLKSSVKMSSDFHGPFHVGTAVAQTELGRVTRLAGDLREARGILESALETKERIQGVTHPSVSVTLTNLGKVYHELGYLTDSLLALQRSQEITETLYSVIPNHPQVVFSQADRAKVLRDAGNLDDSARLMREAIDRYTTNTDESVSLGYTTLHPKYASMLAVMGLILRDRDELEEASKHLNESLAIQEKIPSQETLLKAETLCNLGTVLHRMGDRQGSLQKLDVALRTIKTVKYLHPITATISAARGQLFLNMGDIDLARKCLEEALKIRSECTGEKHPNIALYHDILAQIFLMNGDVVHSKEHLSRAYRTYRSLHERETKLSKEVGVDLDVLFKWERIIEELSLQVDTTSEPPLP